MGNLGIAALLFNVLAFGIPSLSATITIIGVVRTTFKDPTDKIVWTVVVTPFPYVGPIHYFVMVGRQRV